MSDKTGKTDEIDPIIDELTRDLGFKAETHQIVYYRFGLVNGGKDDEYKWGPMAAKPITTAETAMWDHLVITRRALHDVTEERDKLLKGKAVSPSVGRPGPTHGEASEPRRG